MNQVTPHRWWWWAAGVAVALALPIMLAGTSADPQIDTNDVNALVQKARLLAAREAWAAARGEAEAAARLAAAAGLRRLEGEAHAVLGEIADGQGRSDEAWGHYRVALAVAEKLSDRALQATALQSAGSGCWRRGEYSRALALLDQAVTVWHAAGDRSGEAHAVVRIGRVFFKQGRYQEAREHHRRALTAFREIGDLAGQAEALEDLGDIETDVHASADAVELFGQARMLVARLGDTATEARLETAIGMVYLRQGSMLEARHHFILARLLAERLGSAVSRAQALFHLGLVEVASGWEIGGIGLLEGALEIYRTTGDSRMVAWCHESIGNADLGLERAPRAQHHFELALALREEISDARNRAGSLEDIGRAAEASGDLAQALAHYQRALAAADELELPYAALTLGRIGRVLACQGDPRGALEAGRSGVERARHLDNRSLLWRALYNLALIERQLGRREAALVSLRESLATIERVRAETAEGEDRREAALTDTQGVFGEAIALLVELDHPEEALEVAERARARAFLDAVTARSGAHRDPPPNRVGRMVQLASPLPVSELLARAKARSATVIEYFAARDTLFAMAANGHGEVRAKAIPTGTREVARAVTELRHALGADRLSAAWEGGGLAPRSATTTTPVSPADLRVALRGLHELLIEPIEEWLPTDPDREVLIIPHCALFLVPFAALIDRAGHYLVESHTLAFAPALGSLPKSSSDAAQSAKGKLVDGLLIGNPNCPVLPELGPLPPLVGAEAEVRAIAALLRPVRTTVLTGAQASEKAVRAIAPHAPWLHFATHGLIRDDGALESALVLSPGDGFDGLLSAHEVLGLDLDASMVVLSACNTGLGRLSGEGVEGLSRAFLLAGADSVVVSLWPVADEVAAYEMIRLYRALSAGPGNRATALRHAQLATMRALRAGTLRAPGGRVLGETPRLWAPFILVGDAG